MEEDKKLGFSLLALGAVLGAITLATLEGLDANAAITPKTTIFNDMAANSAIVSPLEDGGVKVIFYGEETSAAGERKKFDLAWEGGGTPVLNKGDAVLKSSLKQAVRDRAMGDIGAP